MHVTVRSLTAAAVAMVAVALIPAGSAHADSLCATESTQYSSQHQTCGIADAAGVRLDMSATFTVPQTFDRCKLTLQIFDASAQDSYPAATKEIDCTAAAGAASSLTDSIEVQRPSQFCSSSGPEWEVRTYVSLRRGTTSQIVVPKVYLNVC